MARLSTKAQVPTTKNGEGLKGLSRRTCWSKSQNSVM